MNGPELTCADVCKVIEAMAVDIQGHIEELRELDAVLGDGDLGITVELAATVMGDSQRIDAAGDMGRLLESLGRGINKASPSTFGTLLASAFISAGGTVVGRQSLGPEDLMLLGSGAIEGIKKRGKAETGDKTMLDSLVPAVEAFREGITDSGGVVDALKTAAAASEQGMLATEKMIAKHGRGSWHREDSVGVRDAGAVALNYFIQSFAKHAAALLR